MHHDVDTRCRLRGNTLRRSHDGDASSPTYLCFIYAVSIRTQDAEVMPHRTNILLTVILTPNLKQRVLTAGANNISYEIHFLVRSIQVQGTKDVKSMSK